MEPAALRVLIIDDSGDKRSFIQDACRSHLKEKLLTPSFSMAVSADDGRKQIAAQRFDLIFCDMEMERPTSGTDVIRAAREAGPNQTTTIAGQSRDRSHEAAMRAAGADYFVEVAYTKDNNPIEAVGRVIDGFMNKGAGSGYANLIEKGQSGRGTGPLSRG
jgi:CheY-like chemotaxis protein